MYGAAAQLYVITPKVPIYIVHRAKLEALQMTSKIRQETALADRKVLGAFRYRDRFQMMPIPKEAPSIDFLIGHHPFLVEFAYDVPDVVETSYNPEIPSHALLPMIDSEASTRPRNEVLLLLSTLSRHHVFQYNSGIQSQQWFIKIPMNATDVPSKYDSVWGQGGYQSPLVPARILDSFSTVEADLIKAVERNEYFNNELPLQYVAGKTHDEFELPDIMQNYLDIYYTMPAELKGSFLSACTLLRQGVQLFSLAPSLAFAACVSAIESLIAADHQGESVDHCKNCGQPSHHVRQRFLDFIRRYGNDTPEGKRQADAVYARRSSILHQGQLFLGEIDPRTLERTDNWIADSQSRREVIRFFRICIINWLSQHGRK